MIVGQKFFRVVDGDQPDAKPILQTLYVAKLTAKGGWIVHSWCWPLSEPLNNAERRTYAGAKLVIQGTRRAYAYPTVELALESYKIRKRHQIAHAQASIDKANNGLGWALRAETQPEYIDFIAPPPALLPHPSDRKLF